MRKSVEVSLFYNYKSVGDVLMIIIDNQRFPTHYNIDGDIVVIFDNEDIIGINIFNFSSVCKIKNNGPLYLPPPMLITIINNMICKCVDFDIVISDSTKYVIGKIIEEKDNDLYVDINGKIIKVYNKYNNVLLNRLCVVALNGATLPNGNIVNVDKDGIVCSKNELNLDYNDFEILYVNEYEGKIGQDFYSCGR